MMCKVNLSKTSQKIRVQHPITREKFNTYRFEHYKEDVIVLLEKVCSVSVVTVEITQQMAARKA